jgi:hypothetical protein
VDVGRDGVGSSSAPMNSATMHGKEFRWQSEAIGGVGFPLELLTPCGGDDGHRGYDEGDHTARNTPRSMPSAPRCREEAYLAASAAPAPSAPSSSRARCHSSGRLRAPLTPAGCSLRGSRKQQEEIIAKAKSTGGLQTPCVQTGFLPNSPTWCSSGQEPSSPMLQYTVTSSVV